MKKNSTVNQSPKGTSSRKEKPSAIGMDLGDKTSRYCILGKEGEVVGEGAVATTKSAIRQKFAGMAKCRLAIEVGTHSPWVSRLMKNLGYEVYVANARQVQLISASTRKSDRVDAQMLAKLVRIDPDLLRPIRHRSEQAQSDLIQIRVRAGLVESRTKLVNTARGLAKSVGERIPACATEAMDEETLEGLPAQLREHIKPLVEAVQSLTEKIHELDKSIEQIARTQYPETKLLKQVSGVGTLIALTYVLTVEDRERFQKSRDVGCYVGLRPKQSESGDSQPQLPISKEGDLYLRKLLVQGAHVIMSRRGPDTDIKRWGLKLCERGGRNAKKRAVVAVARKLAVLLHHLWVSGEVYEPLRNSQAAPKKAA